MDNDRKENGNGNNESLSDEELSSAKDSDPTTPPRSGTPVDEEVVEDEPVTPARPTYTVDDDSTNPCKVVGCNCSGLSAHQWKKDRCRHCNHPNAIHNVVDDVDTPNTAGIKRLVVKWFAQHGHDVAFVDPVTGFSILQKAAKEEDPNIRIPVVESLLKREAHINHRNMKGETSLHIAASTGCPTVCNMLLLANADPKIKSYRDGRTALHYACDAISQHKSNSDALSVLVDHDIKHNNAALISEPDSYGWTALSILAKSEEIDDTSKNILIGAGANPEDISPETLTKNEAATIEGEANADEREEAERARVLTQLAELARQEKLLSEKRRKDEHSIAEQQKKAIADKVRRDDEAAAEERKKRRQLQEEERQAKKKEEAELNARLQVAREKKRIADEEAAKAKLAEQAKLEESERSSSKKSSLLDLAAAQGDVAASKEPKARARPKCFCM